MNDETLDKAVWHILAQQMTHAINCEDPKHRKAMSCVAFTAGAHVEMMQLIKQDREKAVKELLEHLMTSAPEWTYDAAKDILMGLQEKGGK